jgi:hypothetical protein
MKKKKIFLLTSITSLLILTIFIAIWILTRVSLGGSSKEVIFPKWLVKSENNVISFIGKKVCESKGNFWTWGTASGRNGFTCNTAFEDYGTECKRSSDCMGECEYLYEILEGCRLNEVNKYFCSEGISGTCSKVEYNNPGTFVFVPPGEILYYKDWVEVNDDYLYINNWSKYKID